MNIGQSFEEAVLRFKDNTAFRIKEGTSYRSYSYEEALSAVRQLSTCLLNEGIAQGDRVALLCENRPEWPISYLAITMIGAVAVPIDTQCTDIEINTIIKDSLPKAVFTSADYIAPVRRAPGIKRIYCFDRLAEDTPDTDSVRFYHDCISDDTGYPKPVSTREISEDALASIIYTSGTTGKPKGVMLSHGNLLSNTRSLCATNLCLERDRLLSLLPLHHTYPFMITCLVPLLCGAEIVYLRYLKGSAFLECMRECNITILVGVPRLFEMVHKIIFDKVKDRARSARFFFRIAFFLTGAIRRFSGINAGKAVFKEVHDAFGKNLKIMVSGGARLKPEIQKALVDLGFTILEGYGLTETSPVVTLNPLSRPKIGSVGLPLPGLEIKLSDPDSRGHGEIAVRGPNVMKGYYQDEEQTQNVMKHGWFHTGDVGYRDRDGYLFITGRIKEIIVLASGKNIYPEEVEDHYLTIPFIKEICITEAPGVEAQAGSLYAVIVPDFEALKARSDTSCEERIKWDIETLSAELPPYRRIMGYAITKDPLPRTNLGKLKRQEAKKLLACLLTGKRADAKERDEASEQTGIRPELLDTVTACIRNALDNDKLQVELDDHLELDIGLDSLARVQLLVQMEAAFETKLPDDLLADVMNVRELLIRLKELPVASTLSSGTDSNAGFSGIREEVSWKVILDEEPVPGLDEVLPPQHERIRRPAVRFLTFLAYWILRIFFRLRTRGLENLPPDGPYLLCSNHASIFDPGVLFSVVPQNVKEHLYFFAFEPYLKKYGLIRLLSSVGRIIPTDAGAYSVKALQLGTRVIRNKGILCIFPEGGRSIDGKLQEIRPGVSILARELNVPLVPVYIHGTHDALPRGSTWPRLHPITVSIGRPLSPVRLTADTPKTEAYTTIAQALRDALLKLSSENTRR